MKYFGVLGLLILCIAWVGCQKKYNAPLASILITSTAIPTATYIPAVSTLTPTSTPEPVIAVCTPDVYGAATPAATIDITYGQEVTTVSQGPFRYGSYTTPFPCPAVIQNTCGCESYFDTSFCNGIDFNTQTLITAGYPDDAWGGNISMSLYDCNNNLMLGWHYMPSYLTVIDFNNGHYIIVSKTTLPLAVY
jgi:hypothetical protein